MWSDRLCSHVFSYPEQVNNVIALYLVFVLFIDVNLFFLCGACHSANSFRFGSIFVTDVNDRSIFNTSLLWKASRYTINRRQYFFYLIVFWSFERVSLCETSFFVGLTICCLSNVSHYVRPLSLLASQSVVFRTCFIM